jgi:hypothetical protein
MDCTAFILYGYLSIYQDSTAYFSPITKSKDKLTQGRKLPYTDVPVHPLS